MKHKKKTRELSLEESSQMICGKLSFAAAEAYKLLRTNLDFSLPDADGCKIIGVTSALSGEGKTTTSINIAYTYAQTGKRVLLLEADMRLPTIGKRVKTELKEGLSNLLIGQSDYRTVLQKYVTISNLWLITAGDVPPNPAELLGSARMEAYMKMFSEQFDVVIVDLPPVGVVSDALITSKYLSGMIVVVRQDYCDRGALNDTMRQLQFADTKILGFVMSGADTQQKAYKRNNYYNHDYSKEKTSKSET